MIVDGVLNAIYEEIRTNSQTVALKGPKVLVLDAFTTSFLSSFVEQNRLLADEFVLTIPLEKLAEASPFPNLQAVFYVQPSAVNIYRVASVLNRRQSFFESAFICFTSKISDTYLLYVAQADIMGIVQGCKVVSSEFTPVFANLVVSASLYRFVEAYNMQPCAVRYQTCSEAAKQLANQIVAISGYLQYNNKGKSKTLKSDKSKRPYQIIIIDRRTEPAFPYVPSTSFVGLADECTRFLDTGVCDGNSMSYFMLSRLSRAFYVLDSFQSEFQRGQCAASIKQQLSSSLGYAISYTISQYNTAQAANPEDIGRALMLYQQQQQISNELVSFARVQTKFYHMQKYLCQISLNLQEIVLQPTPDRLRDVLDVWMQALQRQPLTEGKQEILRNYARAAIGARTIVYTAKPAPKGLAQATQTVQSFLNFLESKAQLLGQFTRASQTMTDTQSEFTNFNWAFYYQAAKAVRQEITAKKLYAQLPKPDIAEYLLNPGRNKATLLDLNAARPYLTCLAEAAVLNRFDQQFEFAGGFESSLAEMEQAGELMDSFIFVIGGVALSEVVGSLVHEYCQGKEYEVERFVHEKVLFISDKVCRFSDVL